MFRCEVCGSTVPARVSPQRLVVATRPKTYPRRKAVHFQPGRHGGQGKWVDDPGGTGQEIAREVRVCPTCRERMQTERD